MSKSSGGRTDKRGRRKPAQTRPFAVGRGAVPQRPVQYPFGQRPMLPMSHFSQRGYTLMQAAAARSGALARMSQQQTQKQMARMRLTTAAAARIMMKSSEQSQGLDILRGINEEKQLQLAADGSGAVEQLGDEAMAQPMPYASELVIKGRLPQLLQSMGHSGFRLESTALSLTERMAQEFTETIFAKAKEFAMQRGSTRIEFKDFKRALAKYKVLPIDRNTSSIVKDHTVTSIGRSREAVSTHKQRATVARKMVQKLDKEK